MKMTYREAITAALRDELRQDPTVLLLGEDIGEAGGVFKATAGLMDEFGAERVRDTPISETGFVGAALGLAVTGFRPVVEIMFADFLGVCFDQIINSIAKHRFMSGGRVSVPLVIRACGGGGVQFGAQHSQTAESWFLPFPGLKVVVPATPADAYELLRAAIQDNNPVVVLEHKGLLGMSGPVEVDAGRAYAIPGPVVVRAGKDVTIVASLAMVPRALEAADALAQDGIEADVINLRTLRPLDCAPIAESVRKTNRLITMEEQHDLGGWGAQVAAQVTNLAFDYLDAPPQRITLDDYPLPFSKSLEDAALPTPQRVIDVVRALM